MIDIVITCKKRLSQVLQSLQTITEARMQNIGRIYVVCYDDYPAYLQLLNIAATNKLFKNMLFPIYHESKQIFSLSKARNVGLKRCTNEWVMFSDADTLFPANFFDTLELNKGNFYTFEPICSGTCIVERAKALQYDENIMGYGGEDTDYYIRLRNAGLNKVKMNALKAIQHSNLMRVENYSNKNLWEQQKNNIKYLIKKHKEADLVPEYISELIYKQISCS